MDQQLHYLGLDVSQLLAGGGAAANCPSRVRARTEATGCGRSSGESAIEIARRSLLPGLYRRSVLPPAGRGLAHMW